MYIAGNLVAEYKNSTTYFAQNDHLGSTRLLTQLSGSGQNSWDYYPFGEIVTSGYDTTHLFTGDEHDTETGLDHTWFRQYSSSLGRWMTPDPGGLAAVDAANPQSWNRYAYVENDPMDYLDPLGLFLCGSISFNCYPDDGLGGSGGGGRGGSLGLGSGGPFSEAPSDRPHHNGGDPCAGSTADTCVSVTADPLPPDATDGGNSSWTWTFVKTFFTTLPSKGPGSCIDVALNAAKTPLGAVQSAAKNVTKFVPPALPTLPFGSAWLGSQISRMAAAGAVEGEALGDAAMLGTIGTVAAGVAKAVPYVGPVLAISAEGIALVGVIREGYAAATGKCHP